MTAVNKQCHSNDHVTGATEVQQCTAVLRHSSDNVTGPTEAQQ